MSGITDQNGFVTGGESAAQDSSGVAQLVEHATDNRDVVGSIPTSTTKVRSVSTSSVMLRQRSL